MDFSFTEAIEQLEGGNLSTIANQARTPDSYLFSSILPERNVQDYKVTTGDMEISATMAGLVAESTEYPEGGHVKLSTFLEETAKIANRATLSEGNLRKLQQIVIQQLVNGNPTTDFLVSEVLNFFDKVILQGHYDTFEWLRAQALVNGEINWKFGGKEVKIDFGVPSGNFIPKATGTEAYDKASSTFWTDVRTLQEKLNYNVSAMIIHIDTALAIIANDANKIEVLSDENGIFRLRRLVGDNERASGDSRDSVSLVTYSMEGEMINPADQQTTVKVPFMPKKKILGLGRGTRSSYRVGEGSTPDPETDLELGYTHIAPTVEGGGTAGRWGRVYTPQTKPWQLVGEGVTNGLPVLENPNKVCVLETEIAGA